MISGPRSSALAFTGHESLQRAPSSLAAATRRLSAPIEMEVARMGQAELNAPCWRTQQVTRSTTRRASVKSQLSREPQKNCDRQRGLAGRKSSGAGALPFHFGARALISHEESPFKIAPRRAKRDEEGNTCRMHYARARAMRPAR